MKFTFSLVVLLPFVTSSPRPLNRQHMNGPQEDAEAIRHQLPRQIAANEDAHSGPYPGFHLNPEWSPDPNNIAPIDLDGVSPWDDAGRSEMVDVQPGPWLVCPANYVNCKKCPRDFRCDRESSSSASSTSTETPKPTSETEPATTPSTHSMSQPNEGEATAVTATQTSAAKITTARAKQDCPLRKCGDGARSQCGKGATCKKNYCTCLSGSKGATSAIRGYTGLDTPIVFVDPGVACGLRCNTELCSEVKYLKGCPELQLEGQMPNQLKSLPSSTVTSKTDGSASMVAGGGEEDEQLAVPVPAGGFGAIQIPGPPITVE